MKLSGTKIAFGLIAVAIAALVAIFVQPMLDEDSKAVEILVTVFSILAGFLIAIIAIVGDPVLLPPGSWRAAELERDKLRLRLKRHELLFGLYLATLALIFAGSLVPEKFIQFRDYIERVYLFSGVLAFIASARLPAALMRVQRERIDAHIEHRRKKEGIK